MKAREAIDEVRRILKRPDAYVTAGYSLCVHHDGEEITECRICFFTDPEDENECVSFEEETFEKCLTKYRVSRRPSKKEEDQDDGAKSKTGESDHGIK